MKATFFGHACVQLELAQSTLLFDPFITPNSLASHINISNIKPNYILLSHGHEDHIADLFSIQKNSNAKVICIAEIQSWLQNKGLNNAHGMNIGGSFTFEFGKVKMVYALHSSSMPDGSYGGNPAGFIIYADGKKIYFAGDTALNMDMKLLAKENLDWAFLPIGDNFTMGIDDAVQAADFINCRNIVGIHYDTFPPIKIDKQEAMDKFNAAGLNFKLMDIGSSIDL